jgi:hypothetical protein
MMVTGKFNFAVASDFHEDFLGPHGPEATGICPLSVLDVIRAIQIAHARLVKMNLICSGILYWEKFQDGC